ncbi:hypothetical protein [Microbacterium sp. NPDC057650]|uniref:hypothetical protein n=1 Tax=unclassified Microbacterium TaxID=2609290 RepID=UPI00366E13E1
MLPRSESVEQLLSVEDGAAEVLFAAPEDDDLPLWPRVRMAFANALTASELGDVGVTATADPWAVRRRLARAMLPSGLDVASLRGARPFLFLMGGSTVHLADGRQRNWLADPLLDGVDGRAHLVQWRPFAAKPAFRGARSLDPMMARVDWLAHRRKLSPARLARIDELVSAYAALFDGAVSPARLDGIRAVTRRAETLRPLIHTEIERMLDRTRPSTVIMEDASYGERGSLISVMKDRGIRVVEPQHGWIGPSHAAYNFGAAMSAPRMSAQLPDELLTFGTFWSEGLRHPAIFTTIGKPHLEQAAASAAPFEDRPRQFLVASSVAAPDESAAFVLALRDALPGWTVLFRPHPSERTTLAARYPALVNAERVRIDMRGDVYETLAEVRAVAGTASTVLFEAARFGVHVFVRRSPFTDYYVGEVFGRPLEDGEAPAIIASRVDTPPEGALTIAPESLWARNAAEAFRLWADARP